MAVAAPRKRRRRKNYNEAPLWVYLTVGSLVSAVFVVPLMWEVFRSFQPALAISNPPSAKNFGHLTLENYRALLTGSDDIIRNVLGKIADGMYSTSERDKFRTRLERGAQPGTTEVSISRW